MLITGTYKLKSRINNFIAQRLTSFLPRRSRGKNVCVRLRQSAVNKKTHVRLWLNKKGLRKWNRWKWGPMNFPERL
jgi:hypothetical protein